MSFSGLCVQCQWMNIPGLPPIGPTHCYGTADQVTPGLLGGFICSCECRHWEKPDEPRFATKTIDEPVYVPYGCLNLRWNDDGSLRCIHDDLTPCPEADQPHTTISTWVKMSDLKRPPTVRNPPELPQSGRRP